tara:strand:- start:31 stop:759 length:729 start_codon:yes stop_codon:yes gene_type:complete
MSIFKKKNEDEAWLSVSDLMAGLMMVFLFISIIYSRDVAKRERNVTEVVYEWQQNEAQILAALIKEFEKDLVKWNAEIKKETLTIRFKSPEVLFEQGKSDIKENFKEILNDFMPRFLLLLNTEFKDNIAEVRIEGHTSSDWRGKEGKEAFIKNMELSQARTRTVMNYTLRMPELNRISGWMTKTISANGLSSSKLIPMSEEGPFIENKEASRRVDFAVRTKTKEALFNILEKLSGGGIYQDF